MTLLYGLQYTLINITWALNLYASQMDLDKFKKMIGSMKIDKEGNVTIINQ